MSVRNEEFARQWVEKATHDLQSADYILDRDGPTDTSAFTFGQSPSARVTCNRPSKRL